MFVRFALIAALLCVAGSALADLTVQAKITTFDTGLRPARELSVFTKGQWVRTELGDKITLRDTRSGKVFVLDTRKKEYRATEAGNALGPAEKAFKSLVKKASLTVKPNGKSRTILGHQTKGYVGGGLIEMALDKNMGSSVTRFEFEQWATTALGTDNVTAGLAGLGSSEIFQDLPVFKPIHKEMAKIKGLTLFGKTTVYMSSGQRQRKSTVVVEVTSVKSSALNSSLFRIPAGYRRVEVKRTTSPLKP